MKTFLSFALFTLLLTSCKTTKQVHTATVDKQDNLVGLATKSDFLQEPFATWFTENYDDYSLDTASLKQLKPLLKGIKIKAIMGTWCGDSRREVPHFYKLLDAVDFDYNNLEMITVNRDKESSNNEEKGLDIQRIPTFIFYKDGIEINRFVEYPVVSLEKDFLMILQEKAYKHSYYE